MRLYVGNLDKAVTKADLQEAFAPFGKIVEAVLAVDRGNSVSKGFGFVEFDDKASAEAAIKALHGKEFKGRSMDVNEARPRTERRSGGGGGGGRRW